MAEKTEIPDQEQRAKLFRKLLGPEEEWDDAAVEIMLELYGIDPTEVDNDLRERLEREVAERRGRGEEVPQAMLNALANPPSTSKSEDKIS